MDNKEILELENDLKILQKQYEDILIYIKNIKSNEKDRKKIDKTIYLMELVVLIIGLSFNTSSILLLYTLLFMFAVAKTTNNIAFGSKIKNMIKENKYNLEKEVLLTKIDIKKDKLDILKSKSTIEKEELIRNDNNFDKNIDIVKEESINMENKPKVKKLTPMTLE